jgi:ABC-type antimicrobial peptide transport system, ATPase component
MNILGCLDVPSSGHYYLNSANVATLSGNQLAHVRNGLIGFVFQGFNLLPRYNAEENIALPLMYTGVGKAERHVRALELLRQVSLSSFARFLTQPTVRWATAARRQSPAPWSTARH